jgi:hypothetical protein
MHWLVANGQPTTASLFPVLSITAVLPFLLNLLILLLQTTIKNNIKNNILNDISIYEV